MVKKYSLKYFISYDDDDDDDDDDDVIRPLCKKLPQMIRYVKHFQRGNKTMHFKASGNKLLKKYNKIWEKVSYLMNIKFLIEPVYGDK